MNKEAILLKVQDVFRDVLEDDSLVLSNQTSAEDIDGWDSLAHVSLMINVEKAFGVKFSSSQVAALQNVGELVDLVAARLAASGRGSGAAA